MRLRQIASRLLSVVTGICTQSTMLHGAAQTLFNETIGRSKFSVRPAINRRVPQGVLEHDLILTRGRNCARLFDCCLNLIGIDPERSCVATAPPDRKSTR